MFGNKDREIMQLLKNLKMDVSDLREKVNQEFAEVCKVADNLQEQFDMLRKELSHFSEAEFILLKKCVCDAVKEGEENAEADCATSDDS